MTSVLCKLVAFGLLATLIACSAPLSARGLAPAVDPAPEPDVILRGTVRGVTEGHRGGVSIRLQYQEVPDAPGDPASGIVVVHAGENAEVWRRRGDKTVKAAFADIKAGQKVEVVDDLRGGWMESHPPQTNTSKIVIVEGNDKD